MERLLHDSAPRISIGLPVYNGQRFIERTLDSLLNQTFVDYELIIADNGSTDRTEEICRQYADQDSRIRYIRSPVNNGIVWNLNRCVSLARAPYFKWAAADDLCAPTFLERCVDILDREPEVVLCYPQTQIIDESDQYIESDPHSLPTDSDRVSVRFGALTCVNYSRYHFFEIFGLMRTQVLRQTPLFQPFARTDSVLIARMALRGRFHQVKEPLFFNRDHGDRSIRLPAQSRRLGSRLSRMLNNGPLPPTEWWNPAMKGRICFPEWRLLGEYAISIGQASLKPLDQVRCYGRLIIFTAKTSPKLVRDVIKAVRMLFRPTQVKQPSLPQPVPVHSESN